MESRVSYPLVGLFVLTLGAAFVAALLWLASGGGFGTHYDDYLAISEESVSGLSVDAPVRYHGVEVGKVRKIRLDPRNPQHVQLVLAIERGAPIRQDTEAVLRSHGLTGIAYVELVGGSPNAPPLRAKAGEYPVIRTQPSLAVRLENVATRVLANLDQTVASVNVMLDEENRTALKRLLADASALAGTLAARRETIDAGIGDLARAARNTARASEEMGPLIARARASAEAVTRMAEDATRTSRTAGKAVEAMAGGVRHVTGETLPEIERLLGELGALTNSLRRLSEQTERNPNSLIVGRPVAPGPGE